MHSENGIDNRINEISKGIESFKNFSRDGAKSAQNREFATVHEQECIKGEKAKITITNYLGGAYYFTVDELWAKDNKLLLAEKKNTNRSIMPSIGDIKDGLIKMILFTNLENVKVDNDDYEYIPVLGLTSKKFKGYCSNKSKDEQLKKCFEENDISAKSKNKIKDIFKEADENGFIAFLANKNYSGWQDGIFELL